MKIFNRWVLTRCSHLRKTQNEQYWTWVEYLPTQSTLDSLKDLAYVYGIILKINTVIPTPIHPWISSYQILQYFKQGYTTKLNYTTCSNFKWSLILCGTVNLDVLTNTDIYHRHNPTDPPMGSNIIWTYNISFHTTSNNSKMVKTEKHQKHIILPNYILTNLFSWISISIFYKLVSQMSNRGTVLQ